MNKRTTKLAGINAKWLFIMILMVGVVPFLLYANTLGYGLIFNDADSIRKMLGLGEASPLDMILFPFTQPYVRTSFVLDFSHYQAVFGWYHLVNVWLHLSAAVALALLVMVVARRIAPEDGDKMAPYTVAALAGLIYGCHPLAVQTASYLSARWAGLGAANFLLAMFTFVLVLSTEGAIRIWCIVLTFAFAVMCLASGEMGMALAPSMVAVYYLLKPAKFKWTDWALRHPFASALTAVFSLAVPFYIFVGFRPAGVPDWYNLQAPDAAGYYATQAKAFLTYYTRAFFVPYGMSIDPPFSQATNFSDLLSIGGLALVAACVYMMYRWRHHRLFFLGMWLTVVGYLPHALVIQQDAVSDPSFYLSLAGLSLIAAWLLLEIWRGPIRAEAPKLGAVVVLLGILAVVHNLDFRNNDTLIASTLMTNHRSVLATNLSAKQKLLHEDYAGAIKDADEAISIDPHSAMGYYLRGSAQLRQHDDSEARNSFEKASDLATAQRLPLLAAVKYGLAEAYLAMDKVDKASETANAGFSLDPENSRAKYLMGLLALRKKNYTMAMAYLEQAKQQGEMDALLPGAKVLLGMKQWTPAFQLAKALLKHNNSDSEAHLILGNAALAINDLNTAEMSLKEALKANRRNAEAMALLSILYDHKGDKVVAESYHNDAVQLDAQIFSKLNLPPERKVAPAQAAGAADQKAKSDPAAKPAAKPDTAAKAKPKGH
jgi:Flp pilus assembly protein TadD